MISCKKDEDVWINFSYIKKFNLICLVSTGYIVSGHIKITSGMAMAFIISLFSLDTC